jgi:hypothetical protein
MGTKQGTNLELRQSWQQEAKQEAALLQTLRRKAAELRLVRRPIDGIQSSRKRAF